VSTEIAVPGAGNQSEMIRVPQWLKDRRRTGRSRQHADL